MAKIKTRMARLRVGDSLDKCVDIGAIVDASQRQSIDDLVQKAKTEGADVFQTCATIPSHGCFYPPTLITNVEPVSTVVQEEVQGGGGGGDLFEVLATSFFSFSRFLVPFFLLLRFARRRRQSLWRITRATDLRRACGRKISVSDWRSR